MKQNDTKPVYLGHRERMRSRLREHGSRYFETYELLEMLLYYVIPRRNTHPTAKLLIRQFSTLDKIFSATKEELMTVPGVGAGTADFLISVGAFINCETEAESDEIITSFSDYRKTGEFLQSYFYGKKEPEVAILLLDAKLNYIDFCKVFSLDLSSGGVRAREFIDVALTRDASVCIIAHNHPHSTHFPTNGDWETNKMLGIAFREAGLTLLESYIVTDSRYCGFMTNLESSFQQEPEVSDFVRSKKESMI